MSKKELSGLFLVLTTALISGFSIFINKVGVGGINPFVFAGSKNFLVAVFLFFSILLGGQIKTLKNLQVKNWLKLILIGFLGGSLPFLLFFKGLSLTNAAQASFIHKNMFLFVAPLAIIFLKERPSKNLLIAALLLLTGNLFFFNPQGISLSQGNLLIFLATALWALESIISKKILKNLPAQTVAFGRMFFGFLFISFFLVITGQASQISLPTSSQLAWIGLTSLLLLGYVTTWYAGLKLVRVSLATCLLVLGAPITALLGGFFLKINPSHQQIMGILLLVSGLTFLLGSKKLSHART